ncbi:MAG: DUF3164 family protein [Bacteroidales bacterium]|jgi:hypothetical protein|nr:DUF3164 family protein [Bacteroidales bacterium]
MKTVNLNDLSPEQRKKLAQEALKDQQKLNGEIDSYKELIDSTVTDYFPLLIKASDMLGTLKREIYDTFSAAMDMKQELFKTKSSQNSHTFTNADSTKRIILGYHVIDTYDDTAEEGIQGVKDYLNSLADSPKSSQLINVVLQLLAKDKQGNLKASKVLSLSKLADESGNNEFINSVAVIRSAHRLGRTKQYVIAQQKNKEGKWENIPLGMTEV